MQPKIRIASMVGAPDLGGPTLAPFSRDLPAAFARLAELGYDGVELMTKNPGQLDAAQIRRWLDEHNLRLCGLCSGHVYGEDKLGLLKPDVTIDCAAFERLRELVDFAASFGPGTLVNIGRSRGMGDPERPGESLKTLAAAVRQLAEYARPRGIGLMLEPIRRQEVNLVHTTQDGLALARYVNHPNLGLMADTYHMYWEDADMYASFHQSSPLIWHVHLSDSNRCWPGSGKIDYGRVVQILRDTFYSGFVSMEIKIWPDSDSAARCGIEHMRKFIPKM
jgi:sugar phosphate isomerase/epimerase